MVLVSTVGITLDGAPPADLRHGHDAPERDPGTIARAKHHFRRLFESMQDVYYRTDAQGVVQHVGPGVRRVLGYTSPMRSRTHRRVVLPAQQ